MDTEQSSLPLLVGDEGLIKKNKIIMGTVLVIALGLLIFLKIIGFVYLGLILLTYIPSWILIKPSNPIFNAIP